MENRAFTISSPKNPLIAIKVIPGHFATSNSHFSHYLDMSNLKSNAFIARDVARELAAPYLANALIDTIVCMEKTEVIGAFLAQELLQDGTAVMNTGGEIHVVTPMSNMNGKLIFHNNVQEMIRNRNILLLVASVSGGGTINSALECLQYYGGALVGISAIFSANPADASHDMYTLFTTDDIPGYQFSRATGCAICKKGYPLDALVNAEGYSKI